MSNIAIKLIKKHSARYIDLRFTDTRGKEQHMTIPAKSADSTFFKQGKMFDGSALVKMTLHF